MQCTGPYCTRASVRYWLTKQDPSSPPILKFCQNEERPWTLVSLRRHQKAETSQDMTRIDRRSFVSSASAESSLQDPGPTSTVSDDFQSLSADWPLSEEIAHYLSDRWLQSRNPDKRSSMNRRASSGSDTETPVASRPSSQPSTAGIGSASAHRARSVSSACSTLQTNEQRTSTSDDSRSEWSTSSSEGKDISPQTVAKPVRGMQWRWRKPPWWKFRSGRANIIDSRREFIDRVNRDGCEKSRDDIQKEWDLPDDYLDNHIEKPRKPRVITAAQGRRKLTFPKWKRDRH